MPTPATPLTPEEIQRRVTENDQARSRRRAASARHVGELARQHAVVAAQLADIERQLGAALAEADEVATIDELARFTDVPATALTQWRTNHKPHRTKRKKPLTEAREQNTPTRTRGTPPPNPPTPPPSRDVPDRDDALVP